MMGYPGILTRAEFATGLITRSVKINGKYLLVENCDINQGQTIDTEGGFLQGGPAFSITKYDVKKISGTISCPIRINKNGEIDEAVVELINHAQNPINPIAMDTNHILIHKNVTGDSHATDNNELLKIDTLMISSLKISCSSNDIVSLSATFTGMIDDFSNSDYIVPDENNLLGRALTWGDCNAFREETSMRQINSFTISLENQLETPAFLSAFNCPNTGLSPDRTDQISIIGVKSVKWGGELNELVRSGSDLNTFIHGGLMIDENLTFEIGPMTVLFRNPLFNITTMPLTSSVLTRRTEWSAVNKVTDPLSSGKLITFN